MGHKSKLLFISRLSFPPKVGGQGKPSELEPGDWFSYKLDIDLPSIPSQKPKRVEIDLCTNDPDNGNTAITDAGETALSIIHPNMTKIGPHFINMEVDDIPRIVDVGGRKLDRMLYEIASAASSEADGAGNRIKLDYDVVFNNIMNNVKNSEQYFVTAGVAVYDATSDEVSKQSEVFRNRIIMFFFRSSMLGCLKRL